MATHKSAEKRARQSLRRNAINRKVRSQVRTLDKQVQGLIAKKDKAGAEKLLQTFMTAADRAAKKGTLHTRNASRRVSRLSTQVAQIK